MNEIVTLIGMFAGGLGLFLIAVEMITDGLRLAAGDRLRDLLGKWTRSPAHGIVTGFTITGIVQSSSAVTVATIGFVNAGLLTLYQALGIVYGANIGTTMTGWLVAIVGFNLNVDTFALPIIGVGMMLRLLGGHSGRGAIGTALAGFGLFFIGIDVLKDAFESMVSTLDLERYTLEGMRGLLMYLSIGFLMTILTQSSSAAIAITLAAATGGVVGIYAAAAMVIGANVGTTSTAVFSVLGATSNAKRVAAAHVIFNVVTAVVALLLMSVMFQVIDWITGLLGMDRVPAVSLALFHTTFNVLGVLLMWPISSRLAKFLEMRFTSQEEIVGRPQFIDKNILVSPALALNAAVLELQHLSGIINKLCFSALQVNRVEHKSMAMQHDAAAGLVLAIGDFILKLQRSTLSKEVSGGLPTVLRTSQYFLATADLAMEIEQQKAITGKISNSGLAAPLLQFKNEVREFLQLADTSDSNFSLTDISDRLILLNSHYEELKTHILETGGLADISVTVLATLLEQNSNIRRMVTQFEKGLSNLHTLTTEVERAKPEAAEQELPTAAA